MGVCRPLSSAPGDVSSSRTTAAVNAASSGRGGEKIEGKKKKGRVFCQEAAVSSAECDFGQGGAEHCLHAAGLGKSCCLALGAGCKYPQLGRRKPVGEPVVVPGCCRGAQERLLLQVGRAGLSFPHARSTSANTLTVLFGLGFFLHCFFFFSLKC